MVAPRRLIRAWVGHLASPPTRHSSGGTIGDNIRMTKPKVLAFHLPQFHTIPENDRWWGEGFTEWTNVRKARPLFKGHYQPRIPFEEKYYNLVDPDVQDWQASLAAKYDISGFCYYHYYFSGKLLLEKPVQMILERGKPDFPFCLAWANEPWTRIWDGGDKNVLMAQTYGNETEWENHFQYLLPAFLDPRYIRVDGKPLFLIYRTKSIELFAEMIDYWRRRARDYALPGLHIVSMLTMFEPDKRPNVCDAFCDFEPMCTINRMRPVPALREKAVNYVTRRLWKTFGTAARAPRSLDYRALWREIVDRPLPAKHYPGAFVDWDNSPRKGLNGSLVLRNFDQQAFESGFEKVYSKAHAANAEFVFINAWNEWAEGTYLEPDTVRGVACLESISRVVRAP